MKNVQDISSVYFIGIGGIGMSALARYFNDQGANVSGYDRYETELTKQLQSEGIEVFYTEDIEHISANLDLVVYTPAIPNDHKELQFVKTTDIPLKKRAEVLGAIVNQGDCYAVAGSHGKSTTSSMLAHVSQCNEKKCTAFLGAIAANYDSNYIKGNANCFVVEADEFDRSFHQIKPSSTIITSVDSDHLDIYGDMDGVRAGFETYLTGLRPGGRLFIQSDQKDFIQTLQVPYTTYNVRTDSGADVVAQNVRYFPGGHIFDVNLGNEIISDIPLKMGGLFNVENAVAVIALSRANGISTSIIKEAFQSYKGLKRRFEFVVDEEDLILIDDYAHHPNEIRAFIDGVHEMYKDKKVAIVFQPHLFSRTQDYADHFAESLDKVDEVIIMEIYPAREKPIEGVSSELIKKYMKNENVQIVNHENVFDALSQIDYDVIATVGAGDVYKVANQIKENYYRAKSVKT